MHEVRGPQAFVHDDVVLVDQLSGQFVRMVKTLSRDLSMDGSEASCRTTTIGAAEFLAGNRLFRCSKASTRT